MEYAIYPQKYICVTQSFQGTYSHCDCYDSSKHVKAIDIGGRYPASSGSEKVYAPFTCKVLAKSSSYGTVYFGSCDLNGNPKSIILADGSTSVVTMAITHDSNISNLSINDIYMTGQYIYDEGTAGGVDCHAHIEFARGWVTSKEQITLTNQDDKGNKFNRSVLRFPNDVSLYPHEVLRTMPSYHVKASREGSIHTEVNGTYTFKTCNAVGTANISGVYLKALSTVKLREYPDSDLECTSISAGTVLPIKRFLGVSRETNNEYQWVMVEHNGIYRYCQLDPKGYSIIDIDSFTPSETLYLYQDSEAYYSGFLIRSNQPVSGTDAVVIPKGSKATILEVLDVQSDSYQWLKVRYTDPNTNAFKTGYVQFDTLHHVRVGTANA